MTSTSDPRYFRTPAELRRWFALHHTTATQLFLGYWKVGSGEKSVTWPESVDEALCFGWIDGVRYRIDADRFLTGQAYLETAYTKLDTPIGIHQGGVMDRPATAAKVVSRFAKL